MSRATLTNGTANIVFPGGFTSGGTLELSSLLAANTATITVNGGTLTNAAGAAFNIVVGAGGSRSVILNNTGSFNNRGGANVHTDFTTTETAGGSTSTSGTADHRPDGHVHRERQYVQLPGRHDRRRRHARFHEWRGGRPRVRHGAH